MSFSTPPYYRYSLDCLCQRLVLTIMKREPNGYSPRFYWQKRPTEYPPHDHRRLCKYLFAPLGGRDDKYRGW